MWVDPAVRLFKYLTGNGVELYGYPQMMIARGSPDDRRIVDNAATGMADVGSTLRRFSSIGSNLPLDLAARADLVALALGQHDHDRMPFLSALFDECKAVLANHDKVQSVHHSHHHHCRRMPRTSRFMHPTDPSDRNRASGLACARRRLRLRRRPHPMTAAAAAAAVRAS